MKEKRRIPSWAFNNGTYCGTALLASCTQANFFDGTRISDQIREVRTIQLAFIFQTGLKDHGYIRG